jgi:hypothetical protein
VLLVTGCFAPRPLEGAPCGADGSCPSPQRCVAGTCTTRDPVAGDPAVDGDLDEPIDAAIDVAVDAARDATPDAPPPPVCSTVGFACSDPEMFVCGNACWVRCRTPQGRTGAHVLCNAWGGYLGQIGDAAEQTCVEQHVNDDHWIGLAQSAGASQPEVGWQWNGGAAVVYTHWQSGAPNDNDGDESGSEQCGAIQADGTWDDQRCSSSYKFLCER